MKFLARQIESILYDDEWTYNNVWNIGEYTTNAKNEKKAFTRFLRKNGIVFYKNKTKIEFDGDNYTIVDRKTGEMLFDAVAIY